MIGVIILYLLILLILLPPLLKNKHKGTIIAFFLMFSVSFAYSLLTALDVPLDGVPFFFSRLIRSWGIKYPPIH